MDKVIIFGCGPTGLRTYQEIKSNSEVLVFLDNDREKEGTKVEGISVCIPEKKLLNNLEYDYIIIASVYGKWQIEEQLHEMGIESGKIKFHTKMPDILTPFLKNLANDFEEENIAGECAEVGVFRGVSAQKINKYFPNKKLYLYDTFEGFSEEDIAIEQQVGRKNAKAGQFHDTSVDIVMKDMQYPEQVIIRKGFFPDTAQGLEEQFCFVRIDVDLYAPTEAALELFKPLMVRGGVMLVHDYFGSQYPGIKKIVREFIQKNPQLRKMPIGDTMTIAIVGF